MSKPVAQIYKKKRLAKQERHSNDHGLRRPSFIKYPGQRALPLSQYAMTPVPKRPITPPENNSLMPLKPHDVTARERLNRSSSIPWVCRIAYPARHFFHVPGIGLPWVPHQHLVTCWGWRDENAATRGRVTRHI